MTKEFINKRELIDLAVSTPSCAGFLDTIDECRTYRPRDILSDEEISRLCDKFCKYSHFVKDGETLQAVCNTCPIEKIYYEEEE